MHTECLGGKFFKIAHGVLENKVELGLSDETFRAVKELKINTKKELIKANAEIEIIAVDIMASMCESSANITEINKLIDKKYALKRDSMKTLVSAFLSLKKTVSKEQLNKLRSICKSNTGAEGKSKSCCN